MAISTMAEALRRTEKAVFVICNCCIETSPRWSEYRGLPLNIKQFVPQELWNKIEVKPVTPQELLNEIEAIEFDSLWNFIVNNNAKKLAERLCKHLRLLHEIGVDEEKYNSSMEWKNYYRKIVGLEMDIKRLKEYFEIEETEPKSQPAPQKQETTPSPLSDPTAETIPTATATQQDEQPSPKKESSDSKRQPNRQRQQVKLSDQQKEELGQYFTADFRGMKDINWNKAKINYFNGIIDEIEAKEWLKSEFAIIALVIFESTKTLNSRINRKNGFSDWYRKFCQAIGIEASKQVKIERLRNQKQYQQIKKSINIWDE